MGCTAIGQMHIRPAPRGFEVNQDTCVLALLMSNRSFLRSKLQSLVIDTLRLLYHKTVIQLGTVAWCLCRASACSISDLSALCVPMTHKGALLQKVRLDERSGGKTIEPVHTC